MEEKKSWIEIIKENKGKIIKGSLIVAGVIAGIVIIRQLATGNDEILDVLENLSPDEAIMDGLGNIGETAENIVL